MSITSITNSFSARLVAGAVGFAMAFSLIGAIAPVSAASLTSAQVQSIISLLQSFGADATTIANVQASLTGGTPTGGTGGTTSGTCPALSRSLQQGSSGSDVKSLQVFLNGYSTDTRVSVSGAGSPGNETTFFGPATRGAVVKFQAKNNVSPIGIVGPQTRAAIAAVCGNVTPGPGPVTPGAVNVSAAAQPANTLAIASAVRVPFTTFTLTNNSSSAVTVNSVTVQRTGLGIDANFAGVVLLDQNGMQIGIAKTLNSNHQTNVGDSGFTLAPGASQTFTVAGNMANTSTAQSGQVVGLQVVAINTSAAVGGSLPINGASHTINTTLTSIGSVSTSTSSFDPGTTQTKQVGSTNVSFSGLRFTAGSGEDLKLQSVRWRQVGSASASDISNVMTYVNGTSYPTTVDSSGKYYTTTFPGGISIGKGNSVDVYIKGDITGSGAASRTVDFDIDKATDLYFVGQTYGYGIAPSGTYTPWFTGNAVSVTAGSASTIQRDNGVAAANIPLNVSNTVLGGFQATFLGEPVSETSMVFHFDYGTTAAAGKLLTNVSLVDQNGATVAGPVDAVAISGTQQKVTFTDTVTFPVGTTKYVLKGRLPTGITNGETISASTTPSADWNAGTGQVTGNSISMPSAEVDMNTMTVQAATTSITVASSPASQTIVAGGTNQVLSKIQIDAQQSGENIRLASLPLRLTGTAAATGISGCQVYDTDANGNITTSLSPNDVENPTATGLFTFTFNQALEVPKGTVKTLAAVCNTTAGVTGTILWGVTASDYTSGSATGVQSGSSIAPTVTTSAGPTMTLTGTATLAITVDSSSPSRTWAAGETTVTTGVIKARATNGAIILNKLGLTLANGLYGDMSTGAGATSNDGANDVVTVAIYDGATLLGTASFTGTNTTATSTFNTPLTIPANNEKLLTVKTTLSRIAVDSPGGIGDLVKVDPLNAQGTSNGTAVNVGATAGVGGVQLVKTFPTLAAGSVSSCTNSGACQGANQVIKTYTVTAAANADEKPVSIWEQNFLVSTSSATLTSLKLFAYDQNGAAVSSQNSGSGQIGTTQCASGCTATQSAGTAVVTFLSDDAGDSAVQIAAGKTYTFKLLGTVAPSAATWTVTAALQGDTAVQTGLGADPDYIATTTANVATSLFVWSDNATTTATTTDVDWFNGFRVKGLETGSL